MSKRGLSDLQVARVREALRRHRDARYDGSSTALAERLGISQPAISQILSGATRPSYGTAAALAEDLGCSVDPILSSSRERAAEIARDGGVPEAGIAAVLAEPDDDSRSVLWWIEQMRAAAVRAERRGARGAA